MFKKLCLKNIPIILAVFLFVLVIFLAWYMVYVNETFTLAVFLLELSYLSNFGLLLVTLFALESIFSSKKHSNLHFERESSKSALENIDRFKDKIMGMATLTEITSVEPFNKDKIIHFVRSESNFNITNHYSTKIDILTNRINHLNDNYIETEKTKEREKIETDIADLRKEVDKIYKISDAKNELEIFSTAIVNGVANEQMTFQLCSRILCDFVEGNYTIFCESRESKESLEHKNTIYLYKKWKIKLAEYSYNNEVKDINKKLEDLKKTRNENS